MNGRLENQLKVKEEIENWIKDKPHYLSDYYYDMLASSRQLTTIRTYIYYITAFLDEIGYKDIDKIKNHDVSKYLSGLTYINKKGKVTQASHSYKATVWSALKSFFDFAVCNDITSRNPMKGIKRDSARKDNVKQVSLSADQIKSLINVLDTEISSAEDVIEKEMAIRDKTIITLFLLTGMRASALTQINMRDVDCENKKLYVIDKNEKAHEHMLSDRIIHELKEWRDIREDWLLENDLSEDALFISQRNQRITYGTILYIVKKYTEKAFGKAITPHKLRSTYATNLYEATKDIYMVQQCMGHADIQTTTRYIKNNKDYKKKGVEIMDSLLD